jgi:hypothetical protein
VSINWPSERSPKAILAMRDWMTLPASSASIKVEYQISMSKVHNPNIRQDEEPDREHHARYKHQKNGPVQKSGARLTAVSTVRPA